MTNTAKPTRPVRTRLDMSAAKSHSELGRTKRDEARRPMASPTENEGTVDHSSGFKTAARPTASPARARRLRRACFRGLPASSDQ